MTEMVSTGTVCGAILVDFFVVGGHVDCDLAAMLSPNSDAIDDSSPSQVSSKLVIMFCFPNYVVDRPALIVDASSQSAPHNDILVHLVRHR